MTKKTPEEQALLDAAKKYFLNYDPCVWSVNVSAERDFAEKAKALIEAEKPKPILHVQAQGYYFVYREGGPAPLYKHGKYIEARKEAERLAKKCPGAKFIVLKARVAFTEE